MHCNRHDNRHDISSRTVKSVSSRRRHATKSKSSLGRRGRSRFSCGIPGNSGWFRWRSGCTPECVLGSRVSCPMPMWCPCNRFFACLVLAPVHRTHPGIRLSVRLSCSFRRKRPHISGCYAPALAGSHEGIASGNIGGWCSFGLGVACRRRKPPRSSSMLDSEGAIYRTPGGTFVATSGFATQAVVAFHEGICGRS